MNAQSIEISGGYLIWGPGDIVPVSGIYRCPGCGREDCCNKGDPFPPQNHRQHTVSQGKIRWRLNVRAETTPV